jgi:prepilin-type N-terminal cleavage/methylation domain-containing protein
MRPSGAAFFWEVVVDRIDENASRDRGVSLLEVVLVTAVLAIIVTTALPELDEIKRAAALRSVSCQLKGLLFRCRAYAVMNARSTAAVFEKLPDGSWRCFIAVDGDGDGIRTRDIHRLVDPIVGEVLHFENDCAGFGILQGEFVPDPSGRGRLRGNLSDPVRAGRGDMITFTPRGTASPASLYLTDHRARMRVLRVYGGTGRVISRVWRSGWPKWRPEGL